MPVFRYRAIDKTGEVVTGTLDALDRDSAAAALQALGQMPMHLEGHRGGGLLALLNTEITPRDGLSAANRLLFTRALATLTGAGLPLDRALQLTGETAAQRRVRDLAAGLLDAVREGASLSDALDRSPNAFPPLYRAVIRAGEAGAALEITLARLADTLEGRASRQGALVSALIYPAFLIVTSIGAVAILLGFVVPSFKPLLDEAGVDAPAVTEAVIAVGSFVEEWWLALLAGFAVLLIACRAALAVPSFRLGWDRRILSVPLLGRLLRKFETARLARLLGMLLENGVALSTALRLTRGALSNRAFVYAMDRVIPEVEAGQGLARPFAETALLPPLARQLLQVGEESGQLTPMLLKTAAIFEEEAERETVQALGLVTPVLTLVMGLIVAVIISSILFALLSINELAI